MAKIKLTVKQRDRKTSMVHLKDGRFYNDDELNRLQCLIAINYNVSVDKVLVTVTHNTPPDK